MISPNKFYLLTVFLLAFLLPTTGFAQLPGFAELPKGDVFSGVRPSDGKTHGKVDPNKNGTGNSPESGLGEIGNELAAGAATELIRKLVGNNKDGVEAADTGVQNLEKAANSAKEASDKLNGQNSGSEPDGQQGLKEPKSPGGGNSGANQEPNEIGDELNSDVEDLLPVETSSLELESTGRISDNYDVEEF